MQAIYKSGGAARNPEASGQLNLDQPAIITLKIAPEKVARYERRGDDLVLVLKHGEEVSVPAFFRTYPDEGRNDLVLEDEAGVHWWGQYPNPWTEFHFTEVVWEGAATWLPFEHGAWLPAGVGALGIAAAASVLAGGGPSVNGQMMATDVPDRGPVVEVPDDLAPDHRLPETEIEMPNERPTASSYTSTVAEDRIISGQVVATDPDGDPLTYSLGTPPTNGSVEIEPDGRYTYRPDPHYHGADSFIVVIDDGKGGTTTSTVIIEVTPVNDSVEAADDVMTTGEDSSLVLNLLDNDEAPDGGLTIVAIAGVALTGDAQHIPINDGTPDAKVIGTVEVDAAGTMRFVPAPNYNGPVRFDYEARDSDGDTATATVSITVTPDAPPEIVPIDGNGDGNGDGAVVSGQGHVTVHEAGLAGGSDSGRATVATGSLAITAQDGVKSVTIGGTTLTLAELSGLDGAPVTINTPHGVLSLTGYSAGDHEMLGVSTGGTITYSFELSTPPANSSGHSDNVIEVVEVSVEDAGGDVTNGEPLRINIVDDGPLAVDDVATVALTPGTGFGTATGNVIDEAPGADSAGADGGILAVTGIASINLPANVPAGTGTLTIQGQYGTLTIDPDGSYAYTRSPGSAGGGQDVFAYTIADADGTEATARLNIDIADSAPAVTVPLLDPDEPALDGVTLVVRESALAGGTDPASGEEAANGSFTFTSIDGVKTLSVGGVPIQDFDGTEIDVVTPAGHRLVITGYGHDPATGQGTVTYRYTLQNSSQHGAPLSPTDQNLDDTVAVVLIDQDDGEASVGHLIVRIIDDAPRASDDGGSGPRAPR